MAGKDPLDVAHPIQRIAVSHGWIVRPAPLRSAAQDTNQLDLTHQVDGIAVTYQLERGEATTLGHGSQFANASIVELNGEPATVVHTHMSMPANTHVAAAANEVLVGVFGRAGHHDFYKREMVVDIGFVIFDAAEETTRIVGVRTFSLSTVYPSFAGH